MAERVSNINSIVISVLNQMKDYGLSQSDYAWLENIAISFYSDRLRGFHMNSVRTVTFPVNLKTKVWSFPADYIKYTKIGYMCQGGQGIHLLGLNNDIPLGPMPLCEQDIASVPVPIESTNGFYLAGWDANYSTPAYASGGGFAQNYYREDWQNGCIRFLDNLPVGTSFIEYLSAGEGVNGFTIVPVGYRAAFEAFLMKRICDLKPSVRKLAPYEELRQDAFLTKWDSNILMKGLTVNEQQDEEYKACGFVLR